MDLNMNHEEIYDGELFFSIVPLWGNVTSPADWAIAESQLCKTWILVLLGAWQQ